MAETPALLHPARVTPDDLTAVIGLLTWQRDRAYAVLAELCQCDRRPHYGEEGHEKSCRLFYAELEATVKHPEFEA